MTSGIPGVHDTHVISSHLLTHLRANRIQPGPTSSLAEPEDSRFDIHIAALDLQLIPTTFPQDGRLLPDRRQEGRLPRRK